MGLVNSPQPVRKRRWFLLAGIVLLLVLAAFAVRRTYQWNYERQGLELLLSGEFNKAQEVLSKAAAAYPSNQRFAFLAAVAARRAGDSGQFELHLRSAERLGLPDHESRLQRLLARTQNGLGDDASESELTEICLRQPDDFTAEQIYEALSKGYMAVYQFQAAKETLRHWILWQPKALVPRMFRAQLAEEEHDLEQAEQDYRAVIETHPDKLDARVKLAQLLAERRIYDEASTHFQKAAELAPQDPRIVVGQAEIAFAQGKDFAQVEEPLNKLLAGELDGELRMRAWRLLADIYHKRKEYDRVVTLLESEAEQGQLATPLYHALIRAHVALNQQEKAQHFRQLQDRSVKMRNEAQEINRLIRVRPRDPDLRYRQGAHSLAAGNAKDAMTWWYTALLIEPAHQASHEALAKLLFAQGEVARAEQHQASAEKSVERTFDRAWTAYTQEDLEFVRLAIPAIARYPEYKPHVQLLESALEVHARQRQFNPERLKNLAALVDYPRLRKHALTVLGSALFQLGRFHEAEEALIESLRLDPKSVQAHRWLAAMYKDIRAIDLLYLHCQEWAVLDPTDYRPHRLIGLESKSRAGFGEAIVAYQEALKRNPPPTTRQEVLTEMAECQFETAQIEEAISNLEPATETVARDILLARCYWAIHREQDAKKLVVGALKRDPKHRFGNLLRADVAIKEKELDVAIQHLEMVIDAFPFDHSGWFKLSQVYSQLGQRDKAEECRNKFEQLRAAEGRYYDTMEKAFHKPEDVSIRRELAARARQIGRTDLAEEWERAASLLESGMDPEDKTNPPESASPVTDNAIPLIEPKSSARSTPDSGKP